MTRDRMGVPKKVLTGKEPRFIKVFSLYRARMAQEFMYRLNKSFWNRARGNNDDVAGKWKELSRNTVTFKRKLTPLSEQGIIRDWYQIVGDAGPGPEAINTVDMDTHTFKRQYTPGQLSPEDQARFNSIVKSILAKDTKGGAARLARARKEAWKFFSKERDFAKLINIRTGRLVAATAPGPVTNNRYYPPQDQIVNITYTATKISLSKVEYAREVDVVRPIIPTNLKVWLDESHAVVMPEVAAYYKLLLETTPKKKRKTRKDKGKKRLPPTLRNKQYDDDVPF